MTFGELSPMRLLHLQVNEGAETGNWRREIGEPFGAKPILKNHMRDFSEIVGINPCIRVHTKAMGDRGEQGEVACLEGSTICQ